MHIVRQDRHCLLAHKTKANGFNQYCVYNEVRRFDHSDFGLYSNRTCLVTDKPIGAHGFIADQVTSLVA